MQSKLLNFASLGDFITHLFGAGDTAAHFQRRYLAPSIQGGPKK